MRDMGVFTFSSLLLTSRASLGVYNTFEDIDILADSLEKPLKCSPRNSGTDGLSLLY
jgi:selenocysteine lyase/cysteine desulfurase